MRAGAAGLRASGSRCDLRSRAALPPCRPRSVGRGGSAPSAPRSTRDVGQRPPQICESDRHAKRGDRPRAPGGASAPSRARPALAGSPHTEDQDCSWPINRNRPHLDVFAPEMLVRPPRAPGAGDDGRETILIGHRLAPTAAALSCCLEITKRRHPLHCRRDPSGGAGCKQTGGTVLKDHPSPDKAQQPRNHKGLQVGVRHHSERHRYVAARPGSSPATL